MNRLPLWRARLSATDGGLCGSVQRSELHGFMHLFMCTCLVRDISVCSGYPRLPRPAPSPLALPSASSPKKSPLHHYRCVLRSCILGKCRATSGTVTRTRVCVVLFTHYTTHELFTIACPRTFKLHPPCALLAVVACCDAARAASRSDLRSVPPTSRRS